MVWLRIVGLVENSRVEGREKVIGEGREGELVWVGMVGLGENGRVFWVGMVGLGRNEIFKKLKKF